MILYERLHSINRLDGNVCYGRDLSYFITKASPYCFLVASSNSSDFCNVCKINENSFAIVESIKNFFSFSLSLHLQN